MPVLGPGPCLPATRIIVNSNHNDIISFINVDRLIVISQNLYLQLPFKSK